MAKTESKVVTVALNIELLRFARKQARIVPEQRKGNLSQYINRLISEERKRRA